MNIDVYDVMHGIGLDERIGTKFLKAGIGFGGSCFPKDVKALVAHAKHLSYPPRLLQSVLAINEEQPLKLVELLKKHTPLKNTTVVVLGLAFKPGTDDIREAASLKIISKLLAEGSKVVVYDPQAMENARKIFGDTITYASNLIDALSAGTFVLIVTEWPEFKHEDLYKGKFVVDGRKVLNKKTGNSYEGVCW